jgi:hypothetical protein
MALGDGQSYVLSGKDYCISCGQIFSATASGTLDPKSAISGRISSNSSTFTATYDVQYEQPANLPAIAGTWSVQAVTSGGLTSSGLTVGLDGSVQSSNDLCAGSGRVSPRASGMNVFDVTMAFSGSQCQFAGKTLSGIAVHVATTTGRRQLVVAALLPDGSDGFLASAVR